MSCQQYLEFELISVHGSIGRERSGQVHYVLDAYGRDPAHAWEDISRREGEGRQGIVPGTYQ